MKYLIAFIALAATAGQVSAICPGFNFAVGNQMSLGQGFSHC